MRKRIKSLILISLIALFFAYSVYVTPLPESVADRHYIHLVLPFLKLNTVFGHFLHRFVDGEHTFTLFRHLVDCVGIANTLIHRFSGLEVTHEKFNGVAVKIYRPLNETKFQTMVLFFHGGGFIIGNPDLYHYVTGRIAQRAGALLVSVKYRRADEAPHPAPFDDCLSVTRYMLANMEARWGIDPAKGLVLVGDSAGGLLVSWVTFQLAEMKAPRPRGIVLIYPALQALSLNTPGGIEARETYLLSRFQIAAARIAYLRGNAREDFPGFYANNYTTPAIRRHYADKFDLPELAMSRSDGELEGLGDPVLVAKYRHMYEDLRMSPLFGELRGWPRTLILSALIDIMSDDSHMMERRLKRAGVSVEHKVHPICHGSMVMAPMYRPSLALIDDVVSFVHKIN